MDDQEFRQILEHFGYSWKGYRKVRKGVKKRLTRHMRDLHCESLQSYLEAIQKNAEVRNECEQRMTVSISHFFRDRKVWEDLEHMILPSIDAPIVRVWCAGCARGEEVYSFQMTWNRSEQNRKLEVIATDLNPLYLEQAKSGIYKKSSIKELPEEMLEHYFDQIDEKRIRVKSFLQENISWKEHDLFQTPPDQDFHLIFLRNNLFTYYEEDSQKKALEKIVASLSDGGYLIIGAHEKIPEGMNHLKIYEGNPCIYKKHYCF